MLCTEPLLYSVFYQVIYALNTKNDEHEAAIATLKEAHEEEVQQILSETREKILQVCVFLFCFVVRVKWFLVESDRDQIKGGLNTPFHSFMSLQPVNQNNPFI